LFPVSYQEGAWTLLPILTGPNCSKEEGATLCLGLVPSYSVLGRKPPLVVPSLCDRHQLGMQGRSDRPSGWDGSFLFRDRKMPSTVAPSVHGGLQLSIRGSSDPQAVISSFLFRFRKVQPSIAPSSADRPQPTVGGRSDPSPGIRSFLFCFRKVPPLAVPSLDGRPRLSIRGSSDLSRPPEVWYRAFLFLVRKVYSFTTWLAAPRWTVVLNLDELPAMAKRL
jgi:hypothetical protein